MRVLVGGAASLAEAGTAPTSVDAMTIPIFRSHDRDMTQYPGPKIVPLV
jgi:hypothetical protein